MEMALTLVRLLYSEQATSYFILRVLVNSLDVVNSPFSYLEITPVGIYPPNCIVDGLVSPFVAGTMSTFYIQTRDFYSNNVIDLFATQVTDQYVELLDDS
jgi:hypothetical protein